MNKKYENLVSLTVQEMIKKKKLSSDDESRVAEKFIQLCAVTCATMLEIQESNSHLENESNL